MSRSLKSHFIVFKSVWKFALSDRKRYTSTGVPDIRRCFTVRNVCYDPYFIVWIVICGLCTCICSLMKFLEVFLLSRTPLGDSKVTLFPVFSATWQLRFCFRRRCEFVFLLFLNNTESPTVMSPSLAPRLLLIYPISSSSVRMRLYMDGSEEKKLQF